MPMDGSKEAPVVYFEENGSGPHEHVCADAGQARAAALQGWLDRQVMIGGVTPTERAVVERAIDDLRQA